VAQGLYAFNFASEDRISCNLSSDGERISERRRLRAGVRNVHIGTNN
jgi:hypothetical protein